jgi:hypothetical protein
MLLALKTDRCDQGRIISNKEDSGQKSLTKRSCSTNVLFIMQIYSGGARTYSWSSVPKDMVNLL